jgi:DNA repair protein RadC
LFRGTIDKAAIYPREIVKATLEFNAAAVILAHNHPSGNCEPSAADRQITKRISDALGLIDVKVLDHVIVGGGDSCSFAQRGLI